MGGSFHDVNGDRIFQLQSRAARMGVCAATVNCTGKVCSAPENNFHCIVQGRSEFNPAGCDSCPGNLLISLRPRVFRVGAASPCRLLRSPNWFRPISGQERRIPTSDSDVLHQSPLKQTEGRK